MNSFKLWLCPAILIGLAGSRLHAQPVFVTLGTLHDGEDSTAFAVSSDGSVVVGGSGSEAFRWTAEGGMVGLGHLQYPYSFDSIAYGVSGDGAVVVGNDTNLESKTYPTRAFRWTADGGMEGIASNGWVGVAYGASFDGSIVVGVADGGFRWTREGRAQRLFPTCDSATAITPDGGVIVGQALFQSFHAFRWTEQAGAEDLGHLDGGIQSAAFAVSADGNTVVGAAPSARATHTWDKEAFCWTRRTGMIALGDFPGGIFNSEAHGVSGDGSIVVGWGYAGSRREGFIWDAQHGMRNLRDVLANDYRLADQLDGWTWFNGLAITPDGRTIVGGGLSPTGENVAWKVSLGPCPADFDHSSSVNSQDFFDFLSAFFTADPAADFNHDSQINSQDFFDYLAAFFAGC